MDSNLKKGIALAVATEVCADTAVIGGVMASRGKAPWAFVAVAGGLAIVGLGILLKMTPAIQDVVVDLAAARMQEDDGQGTAYVTV